MGDVAERLRRVASQLSDWYESKPRNFWSRDTEPILNVFAAMGGTIYFANRALTVGYPSEWNFKDDGERAIAAAIALNDLGSVLRLEDRPTPLYARGGYYVDCAIILASAVIEVLSTRKYGNEKRLFSVHPFDRLKTHRDQVAHLKDVFVMDLADLVETFEEMVPKLKEYLDSHDFWASTD